MNEWQKIIPPFEYLRKHNIESSSWFSKMTNGWINETYFVCSRYIAEHNIEHVAICRKDGNIVTWSEKQIIKNDLFGEDRIAIEIYPPVDELIDDNNVFHLWVYEKGYKFPFSLM